jgi:uncharacterized protein YutE (UPF0331/DUF86 family)
MVVYVPVDVDLVDSRVNDVLEAMGELRRITSKDFSGMSVDERYSMRYNVIVLVEALASLCLHLALEHYGLKPRSYAECFREVSQRLGVRCYRDLEGLARLRNLLVHKYWVIRDELIHANIRRDFRCVEEFIGRVRELARG